MIKKLYLILISFFLIESVYSKEIRSRFGFFIDVPSDYTALQDQNIDELLKDFEGSELNKEYTNEVLAGMTKTEMNIEYYFPNKAMDPAINNMYMMVMNGNIKEYFAYDLKEICSEMKSIFSKMYNKPNLKQYNCKTKAKEINRDLNLYMEHDGPFKNQFFYIYYFQTKGGLTAAALGCERKNCNKIKRDLISIINSISE